MSEVKPGQVWADYDKRSSNRYLRVVEITAEHPSVEGNAPVPARAVVEEVAYNTESGEVTPLRSRQSKIRLDRFRPVSSGYRLVRDV